MKNRILSVVISILIANGASARTTYNEGQTPIKKDTLTVMSYNVHNCKSMSGQFDIESIARVINKQNPDIVAVQELDSMTTRHPKFVLAEIARLTNLTPTYLPTINYSGGKYGIGLLTRNKPQAITKIHLADSSEPRGIIVAEFSGYTMMATHLGLGENDRLAQIDTIQRLTPNCIKPVLLAGDLNFTPESEAFVKLAKDFKPLNDITEKTFPADNPKVAIDYIMISRCCEVEVLHREVVNEPNASDHRPVVVKITGQRKN